MRCYAATAPIGHQGLFEVIPRAVPPLQQPEQALDVVSQGSDPPPLSGKMSPLSIANPGA